MTTTATLLTPRTPGAIAVIAIQGPAAAPYLTALGARTPQPTHLALAHLAHNRQPLDDALVIARAPDHFELHLHGGTAVVDSALAALESLGATITPADCAASFPATSQLERDLLTALPHALTPTAVMHLAAQPTTGLAAWAHSWHTRLADAAAPLTPLHTACQWLLDRSRTLARLLTPPRIALVGPPSAGKSSLANALLGRPVAITSPTPGTTRDWVDALATFTDRDTRVAVTLIDTAGLRPAADELEAASIDRTHQQAARADAIVFVLDGSTAAPPDALTRLATYASGPIPTVCAVNKSDLPAQLNAAAIPTPAIAISALTHAGLDALMSATLAQLALADLSPAEPWAFSPRLAQLVAALAHANDPATARRLLAEISA